MIEGITNTSLANSQQETAGQSVSLGEDFSDFLTLLTTQLQNQDPLAPLDSNQFTEQLVRFSQVEQAINTNSKLDNLVALQLSNGVTGALGYVGLEASYISAEIAYDGSGATDINYSLDSAASLSRINIYDENSQIVYTGEAETSSGVHTFSWDGRDTNGNQMPEGTYVVSIDAFDNDNTQIETTTVVKGRVRGVEQQDGVTYALVGDRAVAISNILNASEPEVDATEEETEGGADDTPTV